MDDLLELDDARRSLVGMLNRATVGVEGIVQTPVAGLSVYRIANPGGPKHHVYEPALALIAQGAKQVMVGDEIHTYDALHYLVTSVDLPVVGQVRVASDTLPYLGLRFSLDIAEIGELIRDERLPPAVHTGPARGIYVNRIALPVLEPVLRLLRLLDAPADIAIVAPLVKREILYRLLMNGEGARLRQLALQDSQTQRIAKAIALLRANYAQALRIDEIASGVHMSVSSFHHHFKAVTAMSPLQFQKQLRLQEARRLLLTGGTDASTAAHSVGYESASQFAREYARMFGAPPARDRRRWLAESEAVEQPA
jgi:AraC-like DNA-binding protein